MPEAGGHPSEYGVVGLCECECAGSLGSAEPNDDALMEFVTPALDCLALRIIRMLLCLFVHDETDRCPRG
jgi:hypothetical protein